MVISSFCKEKVTREILLGNLVAGERNSDIKRLRDMYRLQVIADLQEEMQHITKKLFPRVHFLKKFILYDGLAKYNQDMKNLAHSINAESG